MPISLIDTIPKHLNRKEESFWIIAVNPFYNRIWLIMESKASDGVFVVTRILMEV